VALRADKIERWDWTKNWECFQMEPNGHLRMSKSIDTTTKKEEKERMRYEREDKMAKKGCSSTA
jgi:hypothetical protein